MKYVEIQKKVLTKLEGKKSVFELEQISVPTKYVIYT